MPSVWDSSECGASRHSGYGGPMEISLSATGKMLPCCSTMQTLIRILFTCRLFHWDHLIFSPTILHWTSWEITMIPRGCVLPSCNFRWQCRNSQWYQSGWRKITRIWRTRCRFRLVLKITLPSPALNHQLSSWAGGKVISSSQKLSSAAGCRRRESSVWKWCYRFLYLLGIDPKLLHRSACNSFPDAGTQADKIKSVITQKLDFHVRIWVLLKRGMSGEEQAIRISFVVSATSNRKQLPSIIFYPNSRTNPQLNTPPQHTSLQTKCGGMWIDPCLFSLW